MAAAAAALLLGCLLCGAGGQRVKVREEVVALVGEEAVLPCLLGAAGPGVRVSQVTWVRSGGGGGRRSVAVLHPRLAPSYPGEGGGRLRFRGRSLLDATLLLGPLRLADRGVYTCEFATYPDGTEGASTRLLVLAKPRSQAAALAVAPGSLPVPVATCTAAGGHPAANVTWESPVGGSAEAEAEPAGPDGAVTVTSRFSLVPSPAADKQRVVCVVRHPGLPRPQRLPVALSVLAQPRSDGASATGAIVGGIIAGIVAAAVVATAGAICHQQRKNRTARGADDLDAPPPYKPPPPREKPQEPPWAPESQLLPLRPPGAEAAPAEAGGAPASGRGGAPASGRAPPPRYRERPEPGDGDGDGDDGDGDDYAEQLEPLYGAVADPSGAFVMSPALYV
ncbi:nectin-2 isoform X1 [Struthio camelus]|uniref:nectin-2 isoform X1 n=1 Tax=Struthio camelus TaxID=8801 RepID=UPI003604102A